MVLLKAETSPGKKDLSPAILKRGTHVMDGATVGGGQPNIWLTFPEKLYAIRHLLGEVPTPAES